ncbi:hypothetical protein IWX47DRAFT_848367 [Phyllosticta citricarpa]
MYPASEAPFLKRVKSQKERLRRRLDSNGDIQDIMNQLEMPDLEDQFRGIRVDNSLPARNLHAYSQHATGVRPATRSCALPSFSQHLSSPSVFVRNDCPTECGAGAASFFSQRPHLRRRSRAKSRRRPASLFGSAPTRESRDTVSDDLEKDYSHDLAWGKGLFRAQDKVELDRVGNLHDTPRSWIVVANVGAHSAAHVDSYGYCTYLSFQKGRAIIWFLTFKWIVPKCCQIMPQPGKSVGTSQRDHRLPQGYRFLSKEQHPSVTLWSFSRDERTTQPYRPMVCIWKVVGASAPKIVSETDSKGQPSYSASVCKALRKRVLSKTRVTLRNATNKISAPTPLVTRSQPAPRDQFRHDA